MRGGVLEGDVARVRDLAIAAQQRTASPPASCTGVPAGGTAMTVEADRAPSSAVTRFVVASRYMPVYLALVLLVVVASIWAPAALGNVALSAIAPYGALLGITALGQMLVIMTGGIDLSVPGTFTLAAVIMVGVGAESDDRIVVAVLTALAAGAVIGLVNGILIGGLKLNALIVTLAVGQLVIGVVNRYGRTFPVQRPVPSGLSEWTSTRILGISPVFWVGAGAHRPAHPRLPVHRDRSSLPGGGRQPGGLPRGRGPGDAQPDHGLRGGGDAVRHRRCGAGRAAAHPGSRRRRRVPARPDRGGGDRRRLADRWAGQPAVHVRRRLLPQPASTR